MSLTRERKGRPDIREALVHIKGKPAWELSRSHGSMFFLEMGAPLLAGHVRTHGEWHFLFECCYWRFTAADKILVGSDDDQQFIDGIFKKLDLGLVDDAEVSTPSYDLLVKFSSGIEFRTFSTSAEATDEWTQWLLYGPDDYTWVSDGAAMSSASPEMNQFDESGQHDKMCSLRTQIVRL